MLQKASLEIKLAGMHKACAPSRLPVVWCQLSPQQAALTTISASATTVATTAVAATTTATTTAAVATTTTTRLGRLSLVHTDGATLKTRQHIRDNTVSSNRCQRVNALCMRFISTAEGLICQ
jgi:hypothetical protein